MKAVAFRMFLHLTFPRKLQFYSRWILLSGLISFTIDFLNKQLKEF